MQKTWKYVKKKYSNESNAISASLREYMLSMSNYII